MKNSIGKGAFVLILSGIICKFFGGLFRLPLTNIIGIEGIGIFQMVMSLYSLALVFVSGGVTNALSKLVSSARARGDYKKIGSYLRYGLIFTLSLSVLFSLMFVLFSSPIASVQGIGKGANCYLIVAVILPLGGLVGVTRGLLQGYSDMTPTAVSQIIEQITKFAFGLIFAYLFGSHSVERGVFGAFLGILISEIFAFLYLFWSASKNGRYDFNKEGKREFFSASLPLTFGGVVLPLSHAVEALFIITLLMRAGISHENATALYGLQTGIVGAILNFPLIISLAVAVSLLPNLAFLATQGDIEGQKKMIKKAFLAMWFILLPLVLGIMSVSGVLYPLIYPKIINNYLKIALQLTLLSGISIILTAIMQFLLSLLQANGYFTYSLIFSILGGIGKIVILFITAPLKEISIFSIAISNITLALVVSICILIKLSNLIKFPFFDIVLPLLSAFIMYMVVKIFLSLIGGFLGLALAVILGMAVYLVTSFPLTIKYYKLTIGKFFADKTAKISKNQDDFS